MTSNRCSWECTFPRCCTSRGWWITNAMAWSVRICPIRTSMISTIAASNSSAPAHGRHRIGRGDVVMRLQVRAAAGSAGTARVQVAHVYSAGYRGIARVSQASSSFHLRERPPRSLRDPHPSDLDPPRTASVMPSLAAAGERLLTRGRRWSARPADRPCAAASRARRPPGGRESGRKAQGRPLPAAHDW